ncbi:SRPBCC family protein [Micromonospora sp. LZ34]
MIESSATVVEVPVSAPPERIWPALTVPDEIREWFGWEYDGLIDEIHYIFVAHAEPFPPDRLAMADGSELRVVPDGDGALLRAVLPAPADVDGAAERDAIAEGWRTFFEQLRFLLERRPGGRRRTLHLTDTATGGQLLAVLDAAGAAEQWHASRHQRIVVDSEGRLLAALAEAPLDSDTASPVSLTVSGYGLDDATLAGLREEWTARWRPLSGV